MLVSNRTTEAGGTCVFLSQQAFESAVKVEFDGVQYSTVALTCVVIRFVQHVADLSSHTQHIRRDTS